jgi:hypothetical protein
MTRPPACPTCGKPDGEPWNGRCRDSYHAFPSGYKQHGGEDAIVWAEHTDEAVPGIQELLDLM